MDGQQKNANRTCTNCNERPCYTSKGRFCRRCYKRFWRHGTGELVKRDISRHKIGSEVVRPRDGYIMVKMPDHHLADKMGWVNKAYLVFEKHYGITLERHERLAYIDGDRANLAISNLKLINCRRTAECRQCGCSMITFLYCLRKGKKYCSRSCMAKSRMRRQQLSGTGFRKLLAADVIDIRRRRDRGEKISEIAKLFDVCRVTIRHCVSGKFHRYITEQGETL